MPYRDPEKRREYQRRWWQQRRQAFFVDKACVVCGDTESLELDHVDASTKVSHNIWSWSDERRLAELSKCQVLCSRHHQAKTLNNRENARGEQFRKKLKEAQVLEIRVSDEGASALAEKYGVSVSMIYRIKQRRDWRHI